MGPEPTLAGTSAADPIEVPGYILGARLGVGGFGEVYAARHAVIGREVAIKVLHGQYTTDTTAVARFVAEARAVNQISHPDIIQIFDFGALPDGRQYFVMERLHGETLRDFLRARGRLPLAEALPILRAIAAAVDAAHAAGIAHRDLKPDNVFVLGDGRIKLIDFGLAKLSRDDPAATPVTRTGAVFGTPLYMSPEQCRGNAADLRTDCYSFGMLAYHVLTGAPPWMGDALELALHHLHDEPEPPSRRCGELDAGVDRAVLALLAKAPADRPTPLVAAVDALTGTALPRRRRARRGWLFAAAALAVAGGVAIVASVNREPSRDASASSAATTTHWTTHEVPWPVNDGVAATVMSGGDMAIAVRSDHTAWQLRLGDSTPRPFALADPGSVRSIRGTADGRLVVSREQAGDAWIWLDPVRGARERVTTGALGLLGSDGRIAFVRDGNVYERTLDPPHEQLIASVAGKIVTLDRSPDGEWSAWGRLVPGNTLQLEILNTRTRSIRVVGDSPEQVAVTFVGPHAIAYCDQDRRVRVRELDTDRDEEVLQLARNAGGCVIAGNPSGNRFVVGVALIVLATDVLSLREPSRGWRPLARGALEDFTADGRVVISRRNELPAEARTAQDVPALASAMPYTVDGVAGEPLGTCPGATRAVRRGDELLYSVNVPVGGALAMKLVRPGDCSVAASWTIPDVPDWTFPRCGGGLCVTARVESGEIRIWVLRSGESEAHELTRLRSGGAIEWPALAVSADGRQIALTVQNGRDEIHVIDAATGTTRVLHAGPWPGTSDTKDRAALATWAADGRAVYATGSSASASAVVRVTLDGETQELWSGPKDSGMLARASPDGTWLAANRYEAVNEVHVFDP